MLKLTLTLSKTHALVPSSLSRKRVLKLTMTLTKTDALVPSSLSRVGVVVIMVVIVVPVMVVIVAQIKQKQTNMRSRLRGGLGAYGREIRIPHGDRVPPKGEQAEAPLAHGLVFVCF